jgi:carbonic anhydrase
MSWGGSLRERRGLGLSLLTVLSVKGSLWAADRDVAGVHRLTPTNAVALQWQYDGDQGPSHWGALAPTTASCQKGTHQSPINIRTAPHLRGHDGLLIRYTAVPGQVVTSSHTVEVNFQSGATLEILGRSYALKEFHVHTPSEHHLNGRPYPMEAHLVHRDDTGHLVVLAVLIGCGNGVVVDASRLGTDSEWERRSCPRFAV